MGKLRKIETHHKYELVCDQLRHNILFGDYPEGERLPSVQELSMEFGISQSTVREALRVLEAEGLIVIKHGSGTYPISRSLGDVPIGQFLEWLSQNKDKLFQILEVRELLEGFACGLCALNATDEEVNDLAENLDKQNEIIKQLSGIETDGKPGDPKELGDKLDRLAYEFHLLICKASGNEFANEILKQILIFIFDNGKPYLYACRRPLDSIREHKEIHRLISQRKNREAQDAMRAHIHHGKTFLPS